MVNTLINHFFFYKISIFSKFSIDKSFTIWYN